MRRFATTIAVLVLVAAGVAQEAAKKDMAQLEGEWSMVSGVADGFKINQDMVNSGKRVAKDGVTSISFGGQPHFKARFTIDPTAKPKTIDYVMIEGPTKGKKHLGIYELDGDTVKFCFGAPGAARPTDFTSKEGSEQTLSVWKRDKK